MTERWFVEESPSPYSGPGYIAVGGPMTKAEAEEELRLNQEARPQSTHHMWEHPEDVRNRERNRLHITRMGGQLMTMTTVAIVAMQGTNNPCPGVVAKLQSNEGALYVFITNNDGYDTCEVMVPFNGTLTLQAKDAGGNIYVQPVSIPSSASNVTLRVGPSPVNPQDIQLPPCVPFV